jgi:hypothetical protein
MLDGTSRGESYLALACGCVSISVSLSPRDMTMKIIITTV